MIEEKKKYTKITRRAIFLFTFLLSVYTGTVAQETKTAETDSIAVPVKQIVIRKISMSGNKRTRDFIVMREVPFREGDTLGTEQLGKQLELAKQQIMNTLLFVDVNVYVSDQYGEVADIRIDLKERWYFFPLPYFKLVDRNFNQWWVDQHRSLERVNYGIKFIQNNVTGRNDNLDIWLITGYTQQITLRYDMPFFDRRLKSGFNVGFIYGTQKEVNYGTGNNKQLFYKQDDVARRNLRFDFTYSYRPDVKQRHYFRVSYNKQEVADTVLKINPLFFPEGKSAFEYVDLSYQYKYYKIDYIPYPSKGFMLETNLYKRGLTKATDLWQASARAVYAHPISKNSFLHLEGMAMVKLPFNHYYYNERMIGYGFFQMRGLEYNVVDGVAGGVFKTAVHKQLLHFVLRNPFPSKTHDKIPFRIFLKVYGDLGYGYNSRPDISNTLNNRLLRTGGIGIDLVSIYDFVFKIEYSFNQLGRNGLYLQSRNDF